MMARVRAVSLILIPYLQLNSGNWLSRDLETSIGFGKSLLRMPKNSDADKMILGIIYNSAKPSANTNQINGLTD